LNYLQYRINKARNQGDRLIFQQLVRENEFFQWTEILWMNGASSLCLCFIGREPDIPAWAPLLYQLQLLDFREKQDPLSLPIPDRIRIGNQKRERGNFYFQREEYSMASQAYCMALDVLTTRTQGNSQHIITIIHMSHNALIRNKPVYGET